MRWDEWNFPRLLLESSLNERLLKPQPTLKLLYRHCWAFVKDCETSWHESRISIQNLNYLFNTFPFCTLEHSKIKRTYVNMSSWPQTRSSMRREWENTLCKQLESFQSHLFSLLTVWAHQKVCDVKRTLWTPFHLYKTANCCFWQQQLLWKIPSPLIAPDMELLWLLQAICNVVSNKNRLFFNLTICYRALTDTIKSDIDLKSNINHGWYLLLSHRLQLYLWYWIYDDLKIK